MPLITKQKFLQLAQKSYNQIPVINEILADLDTPLSAYLKLADNPYSYLLESVHGGEKWGRYSIIGLACKKRIRVFGNQIIVELQDGENVKIVEQLQVENPLTWIENYQAGFNTPQLWKEDVDLPRFLGGLVGYFAYETIAYIEPRLAYKSKPDPLQTPDILLMVSDELVVFDNLSGKLYLIVHADLSSSNNHEQLWNTCCTRLDQLNNMLNQQTRAYHHQHEKKKHQPSIKEQDFISGFTQQKYQQSVDKIKQYITDGDAMQVVISQRMSIPYTAPPIDLYRALRSINPSPYMFFLNLGDFHIVGASPEILTRVEDGKITVRPIAGTRPRGQTEKIDKQLEKELLADPKELAEHLMLIDLGRNDIGRVAKTGTVKLTDKMIVERYSHVMHIVSNVEAELDESTSSMDALRATFPAGTVSGAPKIRAMEIINELEPVKRGIYSGAVGYFSWSGNLDTAIAIRTAVIKDQQLHIQAGAGIVADSVPQNEWDETMNKGRSVFRAVAFAECGLRSGWLKE